MNSLAPQLPHFRFTYNMRDLVLQAITDADLAYKLPGDNPTLGALFVALGESTHIYAEGFKSFTQDFGYRADPLLATSTKRLATWFAGLDAEFEAAVSALSEDDIQTKTITRPHWEASVTIMFHTYRECFLIFGAKAACYLRAMGKPLPDQVLWWMG
jgi:hypothetical protein